jgi:hypothetical protein
VSPQHFPDNRLGLADGHWRFHLMLRLYPITRVINLMITSVNMDVNGLDWAL